jgi:hypothetical protein
MVLVDFLMYTLPSGFIGSVATWLVSRKKQDNDMLKELQSSINMLSQENRKILDENIQLRKENAAMSVRQEEMLLQMEQLTKEVERLRKVINKKQNKDEKSNQRDDPHGNVNSTVFNSRVCNQKGNKRQPVRLPRDREHSQSHEDEHCAGVGSLDKQQSIGTDEPNACDGADSSGGQRIGDSAGRES